MNTLVWVGSKCGKIWPVEPNPFDDGPDNVVGDTDQCFVCGIQGCWATVKVKKRAARKRVSSTPG